MLPNQALRACFGDGTPRGIRTPDLLLRRQLLYPAELLAHTGASRSAPGLYRMKTQRSGFNSEKEEGDRGCAALRGFFQKTREAERSKLLPTMERVMGIEPTYPAWKAGVLPLNYTRRGAQSTFSLEIIPQAAPQCQSFFSFFPARMRNSFAFWKRIQKNLYKCYKYSIIFLVDLAIRSGKAD